MLDFEDPPTHAPAATVPAGLHASPQRLRSLARAAQHDILRRLAPPLRHDLVVPLQSLGMLAEALGARLERGDAAPEDLQAGVSRLNRLARQAVAHCLEVCTWMEPAEDDTVGLREGVADLVRLLGTSLDFRGFELRAEDAGGDLAVSRSALRFLLAAAILSLADAAPGPGELVVRSQAAGSHGLVTADYRPRPEGSFTRLHEAGEPPLAWPEVQALAAQHGVELLREPQAIALRLPRALVTTPLKMAPV